MNPMNDDKHADRYVRIRNRSRFLIVRALSLLENACDVWLGGAEMKREKKWDKAQKLRNKDYVLLKMQAQKLIVRNNKQQINIPLVFFFILIGILLQ